MKTITQKTTNSFKKHGNCRMSNSQVLTDKEDWITRTRYFLHGNMIGDYWTFENWKSNLYITDAGRQTNTTKERLNGILQQFGLWRIFQKDWQWYIETSDYYGKFEGTFWFNL